LSYGEVLLQFVTDRSVSPLLRHRPGIVSTQPPSLVTKVTIWRAAPLTTLASLLGACLLAAGIFVLRLADDNPSDAVLLLLVVPIYLVTTQFGWRGGLVAAAASLGLVAIWAGANDVAVGPLGYLTRAVVFLGVGVGCSSALQPKPPGADLRERPTDGLLTRRPRIFASAEKGGALSPRELQVLELIARGATNAQIAERFVISEETVKSHVKHILEKLDVGNRTEAALRYVELYGSPVDDEPARVGAPDTPERHRSGSSRLDANTERSAKVAAILANDRVVIELDDGRAIEVPLMGALRDRFEVGSSVLVYFDQKDVPVAWYLPDVGLGVDLRRWKRPKRRFER
jgi:DNA-binding CsgD family transcriptional regulator